MWLHYAGYRIPGRLDRLTRLQTDSICKMQELIELAKAGKSAKRRMTHKEFVASMKGKRDQAHYDKCNEEQKQRWLSIVNKNKKGKV